MTYAYENHVPSRAEIVIGMAADAIRRWRDRREESPRPLYEVAMPIRQFLNDKRFDPETTRVLGVAFEMVCIALRTEEADDFVKQAIAEKIINLAKAGERNPDILCEQALSDIRGGRFRRTGETSGP